MKLLGGGGADWSPEVVTEALGERGDFVWRDEYLPMTLWSGSSFSVGRPGAPQHGWAGAGHRATF